MSNATSCAVEKCGLTSFALCNCCNKHLCMNHLKEHFERLNTKMIPMVDEINDLYNRLQQPLLNETLHLETLEKWRLEAHQRVDSYCNSKRDYIIHGLRNQCKERLDKTRTRLNQLIHQQGFTGESFDRVQIGLEMNKKCIDEMEHFRCHVYPLDIRDDQVILSANSVSKSTMKKSQRTRDYHFDGVQSGRIEKTNSSHVVKTDLQQRLNKQTNEAISPSSSSSHGNNKFAPFEIFIQSRMAERLSLLVRPSESVKSLKSKIQAQRNIPIENQKLTFMDRELLDNEFLSNYDLTTSSSVNLSWR